MIAVIFEVMPSADGRAEYLEVAHQMAGHEADEDQAGHGHEEFPSDGGFEEVSDKAHRR